MVKEGADNTTGGDEQDDDWRDDVQGKSECTLLGDTCHTLMDEEPEGSGGDLVKVRQKKTVSLACVLRHHEVNSIPNRVKQQVKREDKAKGRGSGC